MSEKRCQVVLIVIFTTNAVESIHKLARDSASR